MRSSEVGLGWWTARVNRRCMIRFRGSVETQSNIVVRARRC
jgi:hypothetical protein